jgi:hypothetical protein
MTPANLVQAPPPVLAGIMAFGEHDTAGLWGPDELAEILRCRMAAPLPPPPGPSAIGPDVGDAPTIGDVLHRGDARSDHASARARGGYSRRLPL